MASPATAPSPASADPPLAAASPAAGPLAAEPPAAGPLETEPPAAGPLETASPGDGRPDAGPPETARLAAAIRGAGMRLTAPRLAVLAQVWHHPHADVETIAAGARAQLGSVSTQTVYDALRALTRADLIRHIEPAGSPARYDPRAGDHHHHVVCRGCGAIADVDCAVSTGPCVPTTEAHGFVILETEVTFWGLCPDCQRAPARRRP